VPARPRLLFVHELNSSFIETDRALLERRYDVHDWQPSARLGSPLPVLRAVAGCDVVVGWWASWPTFWPVTFAWLLGKPSLVIVGGFDVANMPEIGYGHQRGGLRRWVSRWVMHRARRLATNSRYSQQEVQRNVGIPADRVAVMHHGVPDPFGSLPARKCESVALTVGSLDRVTIERKGLRRFVEAAEFAPDFTFVLAGRWVDAAAQELAAIVPDNVSLLGWIDDDELRRRYLQATVYVQASRHEGFGVAVAEAMLAGCVPVVTPVGALPEVVGDLGVQVAGADPHALADAIRLAAANAPKLAGQVRQRVLSEFSLERRELALAALVDELLAS
jgi:glycosyltransferase involved in cell wall biosynthesis